jgi:hypothetical protein
MLKNILIMMINVQKFDQKMHNRALANPA